MKAVGPFLLSLSLVLTACENDHDPGRLTLTFSHEVDGKAIQFDAMMYENAAGNTYEVSEIQWFLSDVVLIDRLGREKMLSAFQFAHYVDTDLPSTWRWELRDPIPPDAYQALKFTFGLKGEKNIPYSFPNPPESNMEWPYLMGGAQGGYHYMKLNGFWLANGTTRTPFNLHLGVGQTYNDNNEVIAFHQNWFEVTLPLPGFRIREGQTRTVELVMDVNEWFSNPELFDLEVYGGKIMKNQDAMQEVKQNGATVFSAEIPVEQP